MPRSHQSAAKCPKCTQRHIGRRPCYYDQLREALGLDFPLSEDEDRTLHWLAAWEAQTINSLVSIIIKLKKQKEKRST